VCRSTTRPVNPSESEERVDVDERYLCLRPNSVLLGRDRAGGRGERRSP